MALKTIREYQVRAMIQESSAPVSTIASSPPDNAAKIMKAFPGQKPGYVQPLDEFELKRDDAAEFFRDQTTIDAVMNLLEKCNIISLIEEGFKIWHNNNRSKYNDETMTFETFREVEMAIGKDRIGTLGVDRSHQCICIICIYKKN